ncbi:MAG: FAD-dependent oxidoreductase, partial [Pseudomonadota bacterium]|nr:FAD-dependent oxidoreductase [Pseudomonadota bacterium]
LNVGCIPTKALIASAHAYEKTNSYLNDGLFSCQKLSFSWDKIQARKDAIVAQHRRGLKFLMQKNKVAVQQGLAALISPNTLLVSDIAEQPNATKKISFKHLLLATGSYISPLPKSIEVKLENPDLLHTSDTILAIKSVPKSIAIIGGGIIGMEFACLFNTFGAQTSVYEVAPTIIANEDEDSIAALSKSCEQRKINLHCATAVKAITQSASQKTVSVSSEHGSHKYEVVLLATGRSPATHRLQLDKIGVQLAKTGHVPVDEQYNVVGHRHIYAIGDVIATSALAHTASAEAMYVVEKIAGLKPSPIDYNTNPNAIYTMPEVASIGATEQELRKQGVAYDKIKYPFLPSAKAKIEGCSEGHVKLLYGTKYREILGAHIVNAKATELISELVLAKVLESTLDELAHAIHPHPTLSETLMETAHAGIAGAIHL